MKKVYWVQLYALTLALCTYLQKWINYLPTDLRTESQAVLTVVEPFCAALKEYDRTHARGRGAS